MVAALYVLQFAKADGLLEAEIPHLLRMFPLVRNLIDINAVGTHKRFSTSQELYVVATICSLSRLVLPHRAIWTWTSCLSSVLKEGAPPTYFHDVMTSRGLATFCVLLLIFAAR